MIGVHNPRRADTMCETVQALKLGQKVPDFELDTYDPVQDDFGSFRLKDQIARKRWTILFFYPADFTFV
jgi:alkyl hydroperoxide reductase subunit AhpC